MDNLESKYISLGIFAHVDAGKTSTSEGLLYHAKAIKKTGRVDHGDAFLDTDAMEKKRGITIFSKQAIFAAEDLTFTLLDTPGHVDFSPEMERVVDVIDIAILVMSATEPVQSHTRTVWRLLNSRKIPVIVFVNKTDLLPDESKREDILQVINSDLKGYFVDFTERDGAFYENIASTGEAAMEEYFESGSLKDGTVMSAVVSAEVFPVLFGSALKDVGIDGLLDMVTRVARHTIYSTDIKYDIKHNVSDRAQAALHEASSGNLKENTLAARVFKITRDRKGERLTHMRIFSGSIGIREMLGDEKITGIRICNGEKYDTTERALPGQIVAVTGLSATYAGQGIGDIPDIAYTLVPVLSYAIKYQDEITSGQMLEKLKLLEEEEPTIHAVWNEQTSELMLDLMGSIGTDVLRERIYERFGLEVSFTQGRILYRETVTKPFEGVGHFEPLRHYAEAHVLIEPGSAGSGVTVSTDCPEDILEGNFQRLIATHVLEKEHKGVLTGSPLTDVHVRVISGRSHEKHTCGGDFRQATYRAIRHGLMRAAAAGCVKLLEPCYRFEMRLPDGNVGRAINDINMMGGEITEQLPGVLKGLAPVSGMHDYAVEFASYTGGEGSLSLDFGGYRPVPDEAMDKVVAEIGYDAAADVKNDAGSVFCAHGAGLYVPWQEVEFYMHLPWCYSGEGEFKSGFYGESEEETFRRAQLLFERQAEEKQRAYEAASDPAERLRTASAMDKELMAIYEREFGPIKQKKVTVREEYDFDETGRYVKVEGKSVSERSAVRNDKIDKTDDPGVAVNPENQVSMGKTDDKRRSSGGKQIVRDKYLLVDGYNVIFAWDELRELSEANVSAARDKLADILSHYAALIDRRVILVFDAYRVPGGVGSAEERNGIFIIYTKESQTADAYIEAAVHDMAQKHDVCVATSDGLEQIIVLGEGAVRMSSRELKEDYEAKLKDMRTTHTEKPVITAFNRPFEEALKKK